MNSLEKFNYNNFGKFINEIVSNPKIVQKRDFLAEKAFAWFGISENDIDFVQKKEIVKELYRYMCLSFYIVFKDNPDAKKMDIVNIKTIEKNFAEDVYKLKKNIDSWQYYLTYFSGLIDGLSSTLKTKDGKSFKELIVEYPDDDKENNK